MKPALKILILEDSIIDADLIQRLLKKEKIHFECSVAMDKESFEKLLMNSRLMLFFLIIRYRNSMRPKP